MSKIFRYESISPKLRLILLGLGLLTVVGIGILVARYPISLYHQLRGGHILEEVLLTNNQFDEYLPCELSPLSNEAARIRVNRAISQLQRAIEYNQRSSQSYLLLGRAYCMLGHPESAIEAYKVFTELRPENPLGHLELGFAYLADCRLGFNSLECKNPALQSVIVRELEFSGIGFDELIENGQSAIFQKRFDIALNNFELASFFGKSFSRAEIFSWSLASIITNGELPNYQDDILDEVNTLNGHLLEVDANKLLWFRQGDMHGEQLSKYPGGDPNLGFLWWNGSAIAVINVDEPAKYQITLAAQHTSPAPIKLQIDHNFVPLKIVELTREDNSWEMIPSTINLDVGLHVIGITFVNDAIVGDMNRNAVISSIKFEN